MLTVVNQDEVTPAAPSVTAPTAGAGSMVGGSLIDEIVRQGARRMLAAWCRRSPKLIAAAQARWRAVNAPHLGAPVRAGARFERGKLVERPRPGSAQGRAA